MQRKRISFSRPLDAAACFPSFSPPPPSERIWSGQVRRPPFPRWVGTNLLFFPSPFGGNDAPFAGEPVLSCYTPFFEDVTFLVRRGGHEWASFLLWPRLVSGESFPRPRQLVFGPGRRRVPALLILGGGTDFVPHLFPPLRCVVLVFSFRPEDQRMLFLSFDEFLVITLLGRGIRHLDDSFLARTNPSHQRKGRTVPFTTGATATFIEVTGPLPFSSFVKCHGSLPPSAALVPGRLRARMPATDVSYRFREESTGAGRPSPTRRRTARVSKFGRRVVPHLHGAPGGNTGPILLHRVVVSGDRLEVFGTVLTLPHRVPGCVLQSAQVFQSQDTLTRVHPFRPNACRGGLKTHTPEECLKTPILPLPPPPHGR